MDEPWHDFGERREIGPEDQREQRDSACVHESCGLGTSNYRLAPVSDAHGLREALATSIGSTLVVSKTRHVFLWKNVRIHLDRVDGLGAFLEFEAVLSAGDTEESGYEQVSDLCQRFGLDPSAGIPGSYVDLLRAAAGSKPA